MVGAIAQRLMLPVRGHDSLSPVKAYGRGLTVECGEFEGSKHTAPRLSSYLEQMFRSKMYRYKWTPDRQTPKPQGSCDENGVYLKCN